MERLLSGRGEKAGEDSQYSVGEKAGVPVRNKEGKRSPLFREDV
jgi:hypothetical protein